MAMDILAHAETAREQYRSQHNTTPEKVVARRRYETAERIVELTVRREKEIHRTVTDRIDRIVCHRFFGPVILLAVIYLFYELSIV